MDLKPLTEALPNEIFAQFSEALSIELRTLSRQASENVQEL